MIEIIPTVVPNSLDDVEALAARSRPFAKTLHIDAADGIFAPTTTWMPSDGQKFPDEDFLYEAHLMVSRPEGVGNAFIAAGAKRIIAHVATFYSEEEAKRVIAAWKEAGAKEVYLALLIHMPLETLDSYIYSCDGVTLMSIASVGKQGMPFDERAYGRVADLHARYPELIIEVDGGVGKTQIPTLVRAGAKRFSVGSALATSDDPAKTHTELLELAKGAL